MSEVSELIYGRQSVGQSVLVSGAHLGPVTNFSFSLKFLLDIYGFVSLLPFKSWERRENIKLLGLMFLSRDLNQLLILNSGNVSCTL
jgi:hypothetical protein